jgi:Zn finger protein HypA/HybF involved in hydrogenase expression
METFMTTCYFPCLCEHCHSVVRINLLGKTKRCPKCRSPNTIPYNDPELSKSLGRHLVAEWSIPELGRELKLTDGNYRCPRCRKMMLRFSDSGLCWD